MKTHPKTNQKNNNRSNPSNPENDSDLEMIANDLTALASRHLPDHVLGGILRGHEADIRQDAVLLAMRWHAARRKKSAAGCPPAEPWIPARAVCAALRYKKLEHAKEQQAELRARQSLAVAEKARQVSEPVSGQDEPRPIDVLVDLLRRAIRAALETGQLSPANASVAWRVFVDRVPARELAEQLGLHRSAIYQHLDRVRRVVPGILRQFEYPYENANYHLCTNTKSSA
jgi:DNA-directed RNA polymerase specialized sigma24 family protein